MNMMKKKCLIIAVLSLMCSSLYAQLEVGASYELREKTPKNGFGVLIQKGLLKQAPLVDLKLRAHFSFFSEENKVSRESFSYSEDFTNYDVGLAIIGELSVGLMEPYVGLGLGSTKLEVKREDLVKAQLPDELAPNEDESNIYWNMLAGAKISIIPLVRPFVEYRYSNASLSDPKLMELSTGRIIFGIILSF